MPGIIVGVDGSERSLRALDWAVREAAIHQAPLTVLTVSRPVASRWGVPGDRDEADRVRDQAARETDSVLREIGAQDNHPSVTITAIVGQQPAEALLAAADDADLLVVGARGAGGFRLLSLGSVCTQIAHHASCPVAVIPADDR